MANSLDNTKTETIILTAEQNAAKLAALEKMFVANNAAMMAMQKQMEAQKPTKKIVKKVAPTLPTEPFTLKGVSYRWKIAQFRLPNEKAIIKAEEADDEIKSYLVDNKRWGVIEIVK